MDYVLHQSAVAGDRPTCRVRWSLYFRAAARSAPIRAASIRRCTRPGSSRTGSSAPRSAPSTPPSSPATMSTVRLDRLREFWQRIERKPLWGDTPFGQLAGNAAALLDDDVRRHSGLFLPNSAIALGLNALVGVEHAAFYTIDGLRKTLGDLVDFERIAAKQPRLTVGAVNVRTGKMHYFDSRSVPITLDHVLASGAVPPGFPAVRIDGDPYWDGGLYSNTPVEVVFDDNPRRDSVVFSVQIFPIAGPEPESVMQVLSRQKDIQFASRADSHIPRQEHIHQLRHMVRELINDAGSPARNAGNQGDRRLWLRHADAHRAAQRRSASTRRLSSRSRFHAGRHSSGAGRPAMPTPSAPCSASRGKHRSTRWSASRCTIPTAWMRRPAWKKPVDEHPPDRAVISATGNNYGDCVISAG